MVVVCPSNPLVSIGPVLAVPGIGRRPGRPRAPGWSPCRPSWPAPPCKGPADRLLTELGHEASVVGVARLYAGWAGTLVIDEADARPGRRGRGRGRPLRRGPDRDVDARAGRRRWPPWSLRCHRVHDGGGPAATPGAAPLTVRSYPARPRSHRATTWPRCSGTIWRRPSPAAPTLAEGDVVVVTQKIVSKAEGRLVAGRPRRPGGQGGAGRTGVGTGAAPARRPAHHRDAARLRLRQRRGRPLQRGRRDGGPAAR